MQLLELRRGKHNTETACNFRWSLWHCLVISRAALDFCFSNGYNSGNGVGYSIVLVGVSLTNSWR